MDLFATPEGTEKFFRSHNIHPDKQRKFDDLLISSLSMGTYLGAADEPTDENYINTILLGMAHGINGVDTASNYRMQRSEKMVKKILEKLPSLGISRNQIIISSKAGFIPESQLAESHEGYIRSRYVEKGILKQNDIFQGSHSIAPKFLEEEIENSLENMGLSCIDVYYINNPELVHLAAGKEVFDQKIREAFAVLEKKVEEKKIRRYGIATWNGLRQKPGTKGLLNLKSLFAMAQEIAGENHHFKAVQLPLNLVMLEAIKSPNQEDEKTPLQMIEELGLSLTISSPLMQARVLSLPERVFATMPKELSRSMKSLQFVLAEKMVSSAIVGMTADAHLHENIKTLQRPDWNEEEMAGVKKSLGL